MMEQLNLTAGAQVVVEIDEKSNKITIEPKIYEPPSEAIDKEFAIQVNDFIERYKPALKVLAKK